MAKATSAAEAAAATTTTTTALFPCHTSVHNQSGRCCFCAECSNNLKEQQLSPEDCARPAPDVLHLPPLLARWFARCLGHLDFPRVVVASSSSCFSCSCSCCCRCCCVLVVVVAVVVVLLLLLFVLVLSLLLFFSFLFVCLFCFVDISPYFLFSKSLHC